MSEGEKSPLSWNWRPKWFRWMREGRENVNLTGVTLDKLREANKRGIEVEASANGQGQVTGTVNKIVIDNG